MKQALSPKIAHELILTHAAGGLVLIECVRNPMSELAKAYMASMLDVVSQSEDLPPDENLTAEEAAVFMSPIDYLHKEHLSPGSYAAFILSDYDCSPIEPITWQTKQALIQIFELRRSAQSALKEGELTRCNQIFAQLERLAGQVDPDYDPISSKQNSQDANAQPKEDQQDSKRARTLKELFCEYEAERKTAVKRSTLESMQAKIHAVSELLNNIPIIKIDRKMAILARDLLLTLPSNVKKQKLLKELSLREAIEKNKQLEPSLETLTPKTVGDYMEKVSSLFIWAKRHNYVNYNPFEKIEVQSKKNKKKTINERHPYNSQQLINLFSSKNFTKNEMLHSYYYWSLVIALYSGARQNEIAQLYTDNIEKTDGIWCFVFSSKHPDQDFKNEASERITPIHSKILELGFLDFVACCKNRIFETGLTFHYKHGYAGNLSKWFARYKQPRGFKTKSGYDFHSFRHTVLNLYKNNDSVEERFAQAIVGHKHKSISFNRYGSEFRPSILKPYVELIEFDFLNIQPFDIEKHKVRTKRRLAEKNKRKKISVSKVNSAQQATV